MGTKRLKRGLDASRAAAAARGELPVWQETVTGGKYVRMLASHVRALRATHGNLLQALGEVFELLEAQIAAGTFFVHRLREPGERTPKFIAESTRDLSDRDRDEGVLADSLGRMAGSEHRTAPNCTLREVVTASPDQPGGTIRLLTNLVDADAWVIGLLYHYPSQVEKYHKRLKTGCRLEDRHYSTARRLEAVTGILAVVAVLLLQIKTVARANSEQPADQVAPCAWVRMLGQVRPKARTVTARDFYRELAKLGGFLGRKCDGEPDWITL